MAKNKLNSADGEGFLRAFTDAWRDLEIEEDCTLQVMLSPSGRKGIVEIKLTAYEIGADTHTRVVARYSGEYPTAAIGSLEATLYQAVVRLERVVVDARRYREGKG